MQNLTETKDRLVTIKEALEEKTKQETDLNMIIENQKDVMNELEPQVQELQGSLAQRNEELTKVIILFLFKGKRGVEEREVRGSQYMGVMLCMCS